MLAGLAIARLEQVASAITCSVFIVISRAGMDAELCGEALGGVYRASC